MNKRSEQGGVQRVNGANTADIFRMGPSIYSHISRSGNKRPFHRQTTGNFPIRKFFSRTARPGLIGLLQRCTLTIQRLTEPAA